MLTNPGLEFHMYYKNENIRTWNVIKRLDFLKKICKYSIDSKFFREGGTIRIIMDACTYQYLPKIELKCR